MMMWLCGTQPDATHPKMWSASFYCENPIRRICLSSLITAYCLPLLLILLISVSVPRSFPATALENWWSLAVLPLRSSSFRPISIHYSYPFLFSHSVLSSTIVKNSLLSTLNLHQRVLRSFIYLYLYIIYHRILLFNTKYL